MLQKTCRGICVVLDTLYLVLPPNRDIMQEALKGFYKQRSILRPADWASVLSAPWPTRSPQLPVTYNMEQESLKQNSQAIPSRWSVMHLPACLIHRQRSESSIHYSAQRRLVWNLWDHLVWSGEKTRCVILIYYFLSFFQVSKVPTKFTCSSCKRQCAVFLSICSINGRENKYMKHGSTTMAAQTWQNSTFCFIKSELSGSHHTIRDYLLEEYHTSVASEDDHEKYEVITLKNSDSPALKTSHFMRCPVTLLPNSPRITRRTTSSNSVSSSSETLSKAGYEKQYWPLTTRHRSQHLQCKAEDGILLHFQPPPPNDTIKQEC